MSDVSIKRWIFALPFGIAFVAGVVQFFVPLWYYGVPTLAALGIWAFSVFAAVKMTGWVGLWTLSGVPLVVWWPAALLWACSHGPCL